MMGPIKANDTSVMGTLIISIMGRAVPDRMMALPISITWVAKKTRVVSTSLVQRWTRSPVSDLSW